jgi:hypothetical protein
MTDATWNDLAARCEAATGADREIDRDIFCLLQPAHMKPVKMEFGDRVLVGQGKSTTTMLPSIYTASLDTITALIERELPGYAGHLEFGLVDSSGTYGACVFEPHKQNFAGEASTPALALCAALCRAKASAP